MSRQGPSYGEIVRKCLRVQAPLGGGKSPTSRCPEAVDWILVYVCVLHGVWTLVPEEGSGLYRVRHDPSHPPLQRVQCT